jgi:Holliday junction resolvase RusA-like endonuclease
MTYSFFCPCELPRTTAQQKGVSVIGGRPRFFTKAKVQRSKDFFACLFVNLRPPYPFNGPIRVEVVMTFPWRKGETKKNRAKGWMPMPVGPDYDNLSKTPIDVMSKLSFWCNDSQIFDGRIIKGWGREPGIRVTIGEVDDEEDFGKYIHVCSLTATTGKTECV